MAISEDTAALVAAQLTETWATWFQKHEDGRNKDSREITELVEGAYAYFKEQARFGT